MERRNNFSPEEIETASRQIKANFLQMEELTDVTNIMLYYSFRSEIKTPALISELLVENKNIYLPFCVVEDKDLKVCLIKDLKQDLQEGAYGIMEPEEGLRTRCGSPQILDMVVVPGLAFAPDGYRIGYGGGYYDRFLASVPDETISVGLCYDSLILNDLPVNKYDLPVDIIVTDKRVIRCNT